MGETLNEQCRVNDEGPMGCKILLFGKNIESRKWLSTDGTIQESHG